MDIWTLSAISHYSNFSTVDMMGDVLKLIWNSNNASSTVPPIGK